ncbi:MAG: hypothetical protein RJB13_466 [Pseudomonadota bacterium]
MEPCRKSIFWGALGGLSATVLTWGFLHLFAQPHDTELQTERDSLDRSADGVLFSFQGRSIGVSQLPDDLKKSFERAYETRQEVKREANLQLYKEIDKIARLYALEKTVALQVAETQKKKSEIEAELLNFKDATDQAARQLYEASDPSAPRSEFYSVKDQLVSYLTEVRRREALEIWSNTLQASGSLELKLSRPETVLDVAKLPTEGLPQETSDTPNAIVFVDYLCDGCVSNLVEVAQRLEEHRGLFKPVYVPFPYTQPEISMGLARASLCAHVLGDFSSFHMAALTKGELLSKVSVFELIRQTKINSTAFRRCWKSGEGLTQLLSMAQSLARKTGLMRTPAIVFQGELLEGPHLIEQLDEALSRGAEHAARLTKRYGNTKSR